MLPGPGRGRPQYTRGPTDSSSADHSKLVATLGAAAGNRGWCPAGSEVHSRNGGTSEWERLRVLQSREAVA
jgi:hypothetical protein